MARRKLKKFFRKRTYGRKKAAKSRRRISRRHGMLTLAPGRALFPPMIRVKLRYEQTSSSIQTVSGIPTGVVYLANGIFDPSGGIGSGQPRGFDQIMPFFNNWVVTGSKCVVYASSNATGATESPQVCVITSADPAISVDTRDYFEDRYTRKLLLGPASGGKNAGVVSRTYSARKWFGATSRMLMQNDDVTGSSTADPQDSVYYHIAVCPQLEGSNAKALLRIVIDYTVIFFKPNLITSS